MRRVGRILRFFALILFTFLLFRSGNRSPAIPKSSAYLTLDYASAINAGDPLTLHLRWSGAMLPTPPEVQIVLFQGIGASNTTIRLDASGTGKWDIPPQKLVQAGTSVILAQAGSTTARGLLTILPQKADHLDLYSTANTLTAYGEAQAMGIALMEDRWGNPISNRTHTDMAINYPDGTKTTFEVDRHYDGFGWFLLASRGVPGRARLSLSVDDQTQTAEIHQVPSVPNYLRMTLIPSCILENTTAKLDTLDLRVMVTDTHGYPVSDGTIVDFSWQDGQGRALTLNGWAELHILAPKLAGTYIYSGHSGTIALGTASLLVAAPPLPAECSKSVTQ